MRMTGSTCALSTLYGRVDRFRRRKAEEELADMASYEIKKGRRLFEPIIAGIHCERAEYALESEAELDASSPAIVVIVVIVGIVVVSNEKSFVARPTY